MPGCADRCEPAVLSFGRSMTPARRWAPILLLLASAAAARAQVPASPPPEPPDHDISRTEEPPPGSAIAVPLPESERKRLKKYDIPELAGARQAIGSQLIDGRLRKPVAEYMVHEGRIDQRLALFEGGLVVMRLAGAGGTIQKRLLLPPDANEVYVRNLSAAAIADLTAHSAVPPSRKDRNATIRVYDASTRKRTELSFDPAAALPKTLSDQITPLQDLLRAMSQDREVTNSIARYQPRVGDHLVGDDRKTYQVVRILGQGRIVELRCDTQPITLYVARDDLYNYFIGSRRALTH
jgi:hypothetical protein